MANFINDTINENQLQTAFNNFVLRFQASSSTSIEAIINGLSTDPIIIYPFDNKFYFNAKAYLKALFDNNFQDTIVIMTNISNINSFYFIDETIMKQVFIEIEIRRTGPSQFLEKNVRVIRGVNNIRRNLAIEENNPPYTQVLQPNIVYWQGYPLDITIHNYNNEFFNFSQTLFNITRYNIVRLIISSGNNQIPLSSPIQEGVNDYMVNSGQATATIKTITNASECGIYIKWINEYGTYSYYLFNDKYIEDLVSSQDEVVNNNFENFSQTISKELVLSRNSRNRLTCIAKKTGEYERDLLYSLGTSPKIWLYTKEKNQSSTNQDWYEIQLNGHTFPVNTPNRKFIDIEYEFVFPENNKQSI